MNTEFVGQKISPQVINFYKNAILKPREKYYHRANHQRMAVAENPWKIILMRMVDCPLFEHNDSYTLEQIQIFLISLFKESLHGRKTEVCQDYNWLKLEKVCWYIVHDKSPVPAPLSTAEAELASREPFKLNPKPYDISISFKFRLIPEVRKILENIRDRMDSMSYDQIRSHVAEKRGELTKLVFVQLIRPLEEYSIASHEHMNEVLKLGIRHVALVSDMTTPRVERGTKAADIAFNALFLVRKYIISMNMQVEMNSKKTGEMTEQMRIETARRIHIEGDINYYLSVMFYIIENYEAACLFMDLAINTFLARAGEGENTPMMRRIYNDAIVVLQSCAYFQSTVESLKEHARAHGMIDEERLEQQC